MMCCFVRRVLAVVLSVALAAGGAAFGAHAMPKAPDPHVAHATASHDAHAHHQHGGHDVAMHQIAPAGDEQPAPSGRADAACCTMCVTASPLPPLFDGRAVLQVTAITFTERAAEHAGTTIRIDPGIPKPTV